MKPFIIAHRGASHVAPENTVAAFRAAYTEGADGIETDVQLTRDGKTVMHHNYSIDANSNGHGLISEMTGDEIRGYDFGSWMGDAFAGEKIPTLAECLETAKDFAVINIELKAPMDRAIDYVGQVARQIRQSGLQDKVIVSAFDHSLLRQLKQVAPEIKAGALTLPDMRSSPMAGFLEKCVPLDMPINRIRPEDMVLPPADILGENALNIPGGDQRAIFLELLNSISAMFPGASFRQVMEQLQKQKNLVEYMTGLDFPIEYLHCEYHACLADPTLIPRLHDLGFGVNPWTVDSEEDLRAIAAQSPDGIITNRPDILRQILTESEPG